MKSQVFREGKLPSVTRYDCSIPETASPAKVHVAGRESPGSTVTRSSW